MHGVTSSDLNGGLRGLLKKGRDEDNRDSAAKPLAQEAFINFRAIFKAEHNVEQDQIRPRRRENLLSEFAGIPGPVHFEAFAAQKIGKHFKDSRIVVDQQNGWFHFDSKALLSRSIKI